LPEKHHAGGLLGSIARTVPPTETGVNSPVFRLPIPF